MTADIELLRKMCHIQAPSGMEWPMKEFLLQHFSRKEYFKASAPEIIDGEEWGDGFAVKFGNPRTAILAHLDSIGFMTRYGRQIVKVGGPFCENGYKIRAVLPQRQDFLDYELEHTEQNELYYKGEPELPRGTYLTFSPDFIETEDYVQCCYMDNRLGVWNALKVAEQLKDGLLVFTCWEEHGAGHAEFAARKMYEDYGIRQALISDITWVTDGVHAGGGVAISIRDSGIPRRRYVDSIIALAESSGIPYQLEVESAGGSDGQSLQRTPYPIDWCFIGAPEEHVHSPFEKVHKADIESMWKLYAFLMEKL
jgi:putative aminopeptidase FrvX